MNTITIQSEGRRHYLVGDTYPIKNAIRGAGCNWDRDRGAWWTGKREVAEQLVAGVASGAVVPCARWVKLSSGFGVRVPAGVDSAPGSTVSVQSREGGTREVTLAALITTEADGARIFAVPPRKVSRDRAPRRSHYWRPCGYPGCNPGHCDECDGEGYRNGR